MDDKIGYEQALLDPGSVFSQPEDILMHQALSREQKIEILRRWTYDASEVCVATEEGMPNGNGGLLRRKTRLSGNLAAIVAILGPISGGLLFPDPTFASGNLFLSFALAALVPSLVCLVFGRSGKPFAFESLRRNVRPLSS